MKPGLLVRAFLLSRPLALATLLAAPLAYAQSTLTWDANNTGTLQTDGAGFEGHGLAWWLLVQESSAPQLVPLRHQAPALPGNYPTDSPGIRDAAVS